MTDRQSRRQAVRRRVGSPKPPVLRATLGRARQVALVAVAAASCALVAVLGVHVHRWMDQPIEEIVLEGNYQNFTQQDVASVVAPYLSSGFLSVDMDSLVAAIESQDWVASASVARAWPNRLQIQVVEYQPVMRWSDQGLLSDGGEVIRAKPRLDYSSLPLVSSEQTAPRQLMTQFRILATALEQADLHIVELRQRPSGDWFVRLDNGIGVELGSTDLRQKIQRVIRVWQMELRSRETDVAGIDARYTHGLVVSWQSGVRPPRSNS